MKSMKVKDMTKRFLALLIAFVMCITAIPATAYAYSGIPKGGNDWRLQRFGQDADQDLTEGMLTPASDGSGFTMEYGKLVEQEGYGSVVVYDANAQTFANSVWEFKMKVTGMEENSDRYQIGLFPRFQDGKNCDGIAIDTSSSLQHSFQVNGSEGWPGISNLSGISFQIGKEYAVKMITLQDKITMYVDGVKAAETGTKSEIKEGTYGIRIWGHGESPYTKKLEMTDVSFRELKNSSVDAGERTIPEERWGTEDVAIPITLDEGDAVASVANSGSYLEAEVDYRAEADRILIKKEYIAAQEGSFRLDLAFEGGMTGSFRMKKYDPSNVTEYVWRPEDGSMAWSKISGSGTYEMEKDGLRLKGENKLLSAVVPDSDAGEIEFVFEQKNDNGRMGFLFRADQQAGTWQGILHDDNYAYSTWYYKNSSGTRNGFHGDGTFLFSREGLSDTRLKLRYWGNHATLWMDGYMMYTGSVSGLTDDDGTIGVSTESVSDILLKEVSYRSLPETYLPEDTQGVRRIEKDGMTVSTAEDFPRVVAYTLNGKKLYGSEFRHNMVTINAADYPASAAVKEQTEEKIVYQVTCEKVNVTFDVAFTVQAGNVLDMRISNIDDSQFEVRSIGFPRQPLLSANSAQAGAKLDAVIPTDGRSDYNINGLQDQHYAIADGKIDMQEDVLATLGFITTDELSASMENNVLLSLKEFRYRAYQKEDGTITAGFENNDFMYRGIDGERMYPDEDLYCHVVLTEDTNEDDALDWQDGANALKTIIRRKINGGDKVSDSFIHVGYNFASQVQQPFLKIADNMKRLSNYIDGFDQVFILKGYANEGHDSAHADYDDINKRAGGAKDMQKCAEIIEDINSVIGIHINHSEAYPEAKMYNEQNMSTYNAWSWLDQSKNIRRDVDIMNGGMDGRLNSMFDKVPGIGFVYVDTYGDDRWAGARLAKNLAGDHNVIMGTENKTDFDRFAAWVHWPGIGDSMHRFVYHQQKDVYNGSNIFRGGYTRSASFMSWQHNNDIHKMVEQFYSEQLPQRYLMNHDVRKWNGEEAIFEGNVRSTKDNKIYKDGNLIADGKLLFIPWFGEDSKTKDPDEAAKIYHWNPNGGESTWILPSSWKGQKTVKLYETTQNGKKLVRELDVTDETVTINAQAKTPYVVCKGEEETASGDTRWSEGSPIEDTSFNSRDFSIWKPESAAGSVDHIRITDDAKGIALLNITGEADGKVSQELKDLIPGQKYRLSVWAGAENGKTARLKVETPDGEIYENYTENTPMSNHNLDTYAQDKKVQRVWVDFVQPAGKTTAVLTLSADKSESDGKATFMETRIVKTDAPKLPEGYAAWEDFEHADQAFGIFAPEGREEYSHLSETHLPYTEDTINGNWSLKKSTTMRTQPPTARILPNTEYQMEFAALGDGKVYVESETDGNRILEQSFSKGENAFAFTTDGKKDYIVRIENGRVIDDFKVYYIEDPTPPSIPENITAEMTKEGAIQVSWDPSTDTDTSVTGYKVYRDGVLAANISETSYLDLEVSEYTTYSYQISAVNAGNTESKKSKAVKGYYGTEVSPLKPIEAEVKDMQKVQVTFNKAVNQESAEKAENYRISDGVTVLEAELAKDGKSVTLTVENLPAEKPVMLTVTGVKDTSSAQNTCNGDKPIQISVLSRYYKFEEDSTETAIDFIGAENGKKTGIAVDASGYNGKAAAFSGSPRLQLSSNSLYQAKEWTLSTWIKWNGQSGESQTIMGNSISGLSATAGMWFHIRQDAKLWASPWSYGSGKDMHSEETIPVGVWTHVAIQFNEKEEFVMYINGKEAARLSYPGFPTNIENAINIGCNVNNGGSIIHKFSGSMDELKIYRTALDADQVKAEAGREKFLPTAVGDRFIADRNNGNGLSVTIDTNNYELREAAIDGTVIDASLYRMESSTFFLKQESIKALKAGTHQVTLHFVKEEEEPQEVSFGLIVSEFAKPVDKSVLYRYISIADALAEKDYTQDSWAFLQSALESARNILWKNDVSQQQADEQAAALCEAMEALKAIGEDVKDMLWAAIARAESYMADDYSKESFEALQAAIAEARKVLEDQNAARDAIEEQIKKLEQAVDGLEDICADKTSLQALYDAVRKMDLEAYTAESVKNLSQALDHAKIILEKEKARKEEVAKAEAGLLTVLAELEKQEEEPEKKTDFSVAQLLKEAYKNLDTTRYTKESAERFEKALGAVSAILEKEDATQAEIDQAASVLLNAVSRLMVKPAETPKPEVKALKEGTSVSYKGLKYKVINADRGRESVCVLGVVNRKRNSVSIPSTIRVNKVTCKVTQVSANAFAKLKNLKKVTIGANITRIGKKAFYGDSKLKIIQIKGKRLEKAGSQALKGISAKAVIKVPSSKKRTYEKILKNKGQRKTVKIK